MISIQLVLQRRVMNNYLKWFQKIGFSNIQQITQNNKNQIFLMALKSVTDKIDFFRFISTSLRCSLCSIRFRWRSEPVTKRSFCWGRADSPRVRDLNHWSDLRRILRLCDRFPRLNGQKIWEWRTKLHFGESTMDKFIGETLAFVNVFLLNFCHNVLSVHPKRSKKMHKNSIIKLLQD